MGLREIVNVQITRETKPLPQKGFGVLLIMGVHKAFTERVRYYDSIDTVADDFVSTSAEYKAANVAFSQSPSPVLVGIGRRQAENASIRVGYVKNSTAYSVKINSSTATYTSDSSATEAEILAGLASAIDALVDVTAVVNGTTVAISPATAEAPFSLSFVSNSTVTDQDVATDKLILVPLVATESITNALSAIEEENGEWYGLAMTSHITADQMEAANWTEARSKVYLTSSPDALILASEATDKTSIAALVKAAGLARTMVMYHQTAGTEYPECGVFAVSGTRKPGSYTLKFKSLAGVAVSSLTPTQSKNARDKYALTYELIAGASILAEGQVGAGEFYDVIVFVDWLTARMTEGVYGLLVRSAKVPFTDSGITAIEAEMKSVLDQGVTSGGIADDTPYTVTVPKAAEVPVNDRAARRLTGVSFRARLAGAIHAVEINGTVTI